LIPDFTDAEPTIYNIDNPSIDMDVDVVSTDNDLGVTVAVDYTGEDDTVPTVSAGTGDLDISTGDYIDEYFD